MTSNDKAKLLGLFFWLFTALNVIVVVVIGVIYVAFLGVILGSVPHKASDPPPELIVTIVAVAFFFALIFTVLFSVPKVVAGYGLRKHKPWARTWAIVAATMCCLSFPIGTAIGVFGLIFLLSDEGKAYFDDQNYAQIGTPKPMMPPEPNSWQ
jgi:uncharacterized membrane protein YbhN (UPF0104 family)